LSGDDAAYVCGVTPAAFRQRASRARARLRAFVSEHCGLVGAEAACRCDRRVEAAVRLGRVNPERLLFAGAVAEMERLHDLGSLMRDHPDYRAPRAAADRVRELIASGRFRLLSED
jgi:hypothetical protein